ncbi:hypothetical protein ONZ45_g6300 [Pleurotus djamor]|nr:hypothetical protein ONZ45_g6300 [Pleurotus djamor]
MSLFNVPGWSVPTAPVSQVSTKHKKRARTGKRRAESPRVDAIPEQPQPSTPKQASKKGAPKHKKGDNSHQPFAAAEVTAETADGSQKSKKRKREREASSNVPPVNTTPKKLKTVVTKDNGEAPSSKLTALQKTMKKTLDGARFRLINEQLYKSHSSEANKMLQDDPTIFDEVQVESWPSNPVDGYIAALSSYPQHTLIADLGCGDAALARILIPQGLRVLSYDLVSRNPFVVEADICQHLPLPGSEPTDASESGFGEAHIVDVVVCALSLMGTNWPNCIREAWRVLKPQGQLKIAEVTSRFTDLDKFVSLVKSCGFDLDKLDDSNTHFTLLSFTKVPRKPKTSKEWDSLHTQSHLLKPFGVELTKLRDKNTSPKVFRETVESISRAVGYEATRDIPVKIVQGESPISSFEGTVVGPKIGLAPILRAGLGMTDAMLKIFPDAQVYHLGLFREKVSLQPVEYYSKLPKNPTVERVFILDPLIATGGTALAALSMILDWGVPVGHIKLLCVLGSKDGLAEVHKQHPDLQIWVAGVDETLTSNGLIQPGLGDAGDRLFNTILYVASPSLVFLSQTMVALVPDSAPNAWREQNLFENPHIPASHIIEWLSSRRSSSSVVYIYDLAEQSGFGLLTAQMATGSKGTAPVVHLQARPGAGLNLVGRLSEGTSHQGIGGAVLTAYTTLTGLAAMAPSLAKLPPAHLDSRLILQVPSVVTTGNNYALSSSFAPLSTVLQLLPKDSIVLVSASPQESVDFAALSYSIKDKHVIHLFDQYATAREVGHSIVAPNPPVIVDEAKSLGAISFQYHGDRNARDVLVMLNSPLSQVAKAYVDQIPGLGLVVVKVPRPWNDAAFVDLLPSTAQKVHVLDEVSSPGLRGFLFAEVLGSLLNSPKSPTVLSQSLTTTQIQTYLSKKDEFLAFIAFFALRKATPLPELASSQAKKLVVFNSPRSLFGSFSSLIKDLFFKTQNIATHLLTDHDMLSKPGGISIDRIVLTPDAGVDASLPVPVAMPLDGTSEGAADFTAILDHSILKTHSLAKYAKPESVILLVSPWTAAELSSSLPAETLSIVSSRHLRIFLFNAKSLADDIKPSGIANDTKQNILVYLAFLRLYLGKAADEALVRKLAATVFNDEIHGVPLSTFTSLAWSGLEEVTITPTEEETTAPLKDVVVNAIVAEVETEETISSRIETWHGAARHLIFPDVYKPPSPPALDEEFPQNPALRPELPERTYLVTCTVNRRLTPLEYDRNVFHLEFDTSGTGLKYAIGEALGVHGWNDAQEVLDFCAWYGVDPDRLITIPLPSSEGTKMHTRTIFQALQQQIDLFGHPAKSFYSELAPYATNSVDKHALQFIGSPEGSSTYKKLSEKDTVHFIDVLKTYPSARPSIEILCTLIGDIKPRHYSIASAQAVVGNRVDLLVVTVDWVTPNGTPRYGQCTRYLSDLKIGQKVTVSIKPSVMKLPPNNLQPIIMAGLGTGAAPFRAFLQYRAWLAQQGEKVGPIYYYFGSRHQSQEYLYGEEIEAYILDGTITKAGLAFSRDGARKVYIQHKMLEDAEALARMLKEDDGAFYLCGPTWPVPDVYNALVGALVKYNGMTETDAGEYLESLKEEERYVLEVY